MPKNKKKVPHSAVSRADKKIPKINEPRSSENDQPSWRFSTADHSGGPFAWPKGMDAELEIVSKLHHFDSMSWFEIQGKQHHYLSINCLSKEAISRLEEIQLDDEIENLFSFHLQGKPRIICIRHQNIAKLLWYDPEHQVAPSTKKHT